MSITKPREVFSLPNVHYADFYNFYKVLLIPNSRKNMYSRKAFFMFFIYNKQATRS